MTITLRNDFHNTSISLRADRGQELSLSQMRRARRTLCGIKGCLCSGNLGERGRQDVDIQAWDSRDGQLRIRLV